MMGPQSYNQRFKPGTVVLINPSTAVYHDRRNEFGTVVDNFVDFDIETGKRTEKVLVMWSSDASTEWMHLYQVLLVPSVVGEG